MFVDGVNKVERVSEFFGYTEEYVLARPYLWLLRKFKQYDRTQYERRRYRQTDQFNADFAILDLKHNGGKGVEKILLPDYDEMIGKVDAGIYKDTTQPMNGKTQSAQLFKPEDFDPFALMPQSTKERIEKQKS